MRAKNVIELFVLGLVTFIGVHVLGVEKDGDPGGGDFEVTIVSDPSHTTAEGTVHNCVNEVVELSWRGNPTPPNNVCEGEWAEQVDQRTFKWIGSIDGATNGNNAKLNTATEGSASVEFVVTCKWICSKSGGTGQTKGKGSFETLIVGKGEPQDPDAPQGGEVQLGDRTIDTTFNTKFGVTLIQNHLKGDLRRVKGNKSYEFVETLNPGDCGISQNYPHTVGGSSLLGSTGIDFSFNIPGVPVSVNVPFSFEGSGNEVQINIPRQEFRMADRIAIYRRMIADVAGSFTGLYKYRTLNATPVRSGSRNYNGENLNSPTREPVAYREVHRLVKCCPSN